MTWSESVATVQKSQWIIIPIDADYQVARGEAQESRAQITEMAELTRGHTPITGIDAFLFLKLNLIGLFFIF